MVQIHTLPPKGITMIQLAVTCIFVDYWLVVGATGAATILAILLIADVLDSKGWLALF